ncbi:MAG: PH domain-containing protein [Candidatus Heimdallarchaeota archaeon]
MTKYYISSIIIFLATILFTAAFLVPMSIIEYNPQIWIIGYVIGGISVAGLGCAFILFPFYYRSIRYELTDKEMIVYRGFIQKVMKVVPLRAITNIAVVRGPIDRIIGIGRIQIHTAGYSTNQGPEEKIDGLIQYQEIYETLSQKIKQFRPMTPLASLEEEDHPIIEPTDINVAILSELKEIKEILKNK